MTTSAGFTAAAALSEARPITQRPSSAASAICFRVEVLVKVVFMVRRV